MKKVKLSKLDSELLQSQKLDNIQQQSVKGGRTIHVTNIHDDGTADPDNVWIEYD